MQIHGKVGEINGAVGSPYPLTLNQKGALYVSPSAGKLATAAQAGRLFTIANQAAVATTANLNTTWTGLGFANPSTSGKNAIVHEFGWALSLAGSTAGIVGLMTSDTTGFADALTIRNCLDGSATASSMYADDGATIATPVLRRVYGDYGTEDTATSLGTKGPHVVYVDGSLVIPPGRSVMTYTSLATTAAFLFYFMWEEIDEDYS